MRSRLCRAAGIAGVLLAISLAVAQAGRVPQPVQLQDTVKAGHADLWTMSFTGGELAQVSVSPNDGVSDIDLIIYDAHMDQMGAETAAIRPSVNWTPLGTAAYKIRVVNNENRPVRYTLTTN